MSPWQFFRDVSPAMIYAFSTCSSSGTLPISMESARKLGVPNQISSFVLPLGATVNMDGTSPCIKGYRFYSSLKSMESALALVSS